MAHEGMHCARDSAQRADLPGLARTADGSVGASRARGSHRTSLRENGTPNSETNGTPTARKGNNCPRAYATRCIRGRCLEGSARESRGDAFPAGPRAPIGPVLPISPLPPGWPSAPALPARTALQPQPCSHTTDATHDREPFRCACTAQGEGCVGTVSAAMCLAAWQTLARAGRSVSRAYVDLTECTATPSSVGFAPRLVRRRERMRMECARVDVPICTAVLSRMEERTIGAVLAGFAVGALLAGLAGRAGLSGEASRPGNP